MDQSHFPNNRVPITHLSRRDGQILDAVLETGRSPHQADPNRAERLDHLLAVIGQCPAEDPNPDLGDRTLQHIRQQRNEARLAAQIQMLRGDGDSGGGRFSFSWAQMGVAAAVVVIAFSLLLPMLAHNRHLAHRFLCQQNLHDASQAMGAFAADNNGILPRGDVEPGSVWWNVGEDRKPDQPVRSNSAHLYLLVRQGYASPQMLSCPSNEHVHPENLGPDRHDWPEPQAVSYSYQNQYTAEPIRLAPNADLAVLADKNPLFTSRTGRVVYDPDQPKTAASRQHNRRGQNVLTLDGAAVWRLTPTIDRPGAEPDNIWGLRGVDRYTGTEAPRQPDDSFLVP